MSTVHRSPHPSLLHSTVGPLETFVFVTPGDSLLTWTLVFAICAMTSPVLRGPWAGPEKQRQLKEPGHSLWRYLGKCTCTPLWDDNCPQAHPLLPAGLPPQPARAASTINSSSLRSPVHSLQPSEGL